MKLRNLFFALLLAVGAIGFTSCTGDDGDAGPAGEQGPPGEQGEQGPPGEDAGDVEYGYGFLVNWGKPSGSMSCEDDVLNTTGVFPGPDLTPIPAAQNAVRMAPAASNADTANGYVQVDCLNTMFNENANPDLDGDGEGDLAAGYTANSGLLFVKTERGMEQSSDRTEATTSSPALVTTVTKTFSGGYVFANMDIRGGSDEGIQRDRLNHVCQVGTAPPSIKGHFRAVTIVDESKNVRLSNDAATRGLQEDIPNTTVTKTTQKVCVRLDSLPGVVKCYVKNVVAVPATPLGNAAGVAANAGTDTIGIYNPDGTLTPVMPAAETGATNTGQVGPANGGNDEQFIADANDFQGAKLCNLFREAAPAF